jgi:hypothetical protein
MDALLTAGITQVALTADTPISFFGILSLVHYDAKSGEVHAMNAEWNTVLGETDPLSIPGGIDISSPAGIRGTATSGRTALVGGFNEGSRRRARALRTAAVRAILRAGDLGGGEGLLRDREDGGLLGAARRRPNDGAYAGSAAIASSKRVSASSTDSVVHRFIS